MPRQLDHLLKLTRADEHLDALRGEIQWWAASQPYRIIREPDPESDFTVISAEPFGKPPAKIGLIVGDVVHNLRSCLDQMALRIAECSSGGRLSDDVERRSQFPICDKPAWFAKAALTQIAGIVCKPRALIESVQPYMGRQEMQAPKALRDLSAIDKQRRLPVGAQYARLTAAAA